MVVSQSNDEGARSTENDLAKLAGDVESMSKNKCRVFWTASMALSADGTMIAAGSGEGPIYLWDAAAQEMIAEYHKRKES